MNNEVVLTQHAQRLLSNSLLSSHSDSYTRYLTERGYSFSSIKDYVSCIAHFAHWLKNRRATLGQIDEALAQRFLDDHLPRCKCPGRVQRCHHQVRAALKHLLSALRLNAKIPLPQDKTPASIREEICRFDAYLDQVCGVATVTRLKRTSIIRTFLFEQFGKDRIDIKGVTPKHVCQFVIDHTKGCKPSTGKIIGVAMRSYLKFRGIHGDCVQTLLASIPHIAEWRLASLPNVLSVEELEQFLNAFDCQTPTGRRDYAMARCLVDLGLRVGEVARLQLGDIHWRKGTVHLNGSKARREDVLPLPPQTGRAIATYLRDGRPVSVSRALFLRHVAPLCEPIGPGVVRIAVRRAYAQCGWSHRWTGTHVLRHSVASRLLQTGRPMKEIADILRHRCLDSTAIYAKVDTNKLADIAMPWPGSTS